MALAIQKQAGPFKRWVFARVAKWAGYLPGSILKRGDDTYILDARGCWRRCANKRMGE